MSTPLPDSLRLCQYHHRRRVNPKPRPLAQWTCTTPTGKRVGICAACKRKIGAELWTGLFNWDFQPIDHL